MLQSARRVLFIPKSSFLGPRGSRRFTTELPPQLQASLFELNAEVENLFGPLGDPDYDSDPPSVSNPAFSPRRAFQPSSTPPLTLQQPPNHGAQRAMIETSDRPASPASNNDDNSIQKLIDEHQKQLLRHVSEIITDSYLQLGAALRTELRLRDMRRDR